MPFGTDNGNAVMAVLVVWFWLGMGVVGVVVGMVAVLVRLRGLWAGPRRVVNVDRWVGQHRCRVPCGFDNGKVMMAVWCV